MSDAPRTIADAAAALRSGAVTSVELTQRAIARADDADKRLGVYLHRSDEAALAAAARADADLAGGTDRGPLHGIPLCIKDIVATRDAPTTAQSLVLDPAWGDRGDAPVVARLRAAGAVFTGKTSTMEFAIGMPDPEKPFPVPRNPWSDDRWAGGSSSGTASGTAAGMCFGGVGTDTGGSIRIPAAYCGVTGLKPTFGRVPKEGVFPLAGSLDHVGPIARSAEDCALMLSVMAGHDAADPFSADVPVGDYLGGLRDSVEGLRIGVERAHHVDAPGTDPAAVERFDAAVDALRDAGAVVSDVELPLYNEMAAASALLMFAEGHTYHHDDLVRAWSDYGVHTREVLALGAFFSGRDIIQAERVRRAGRRAVDELFDSYDAIVCLTAGTGAPEVDGMTLLTVLGMPVFTGVWNGLGVPVLSVPIGFDAEGLPIGMQIAGRAFDEATVLRVGHAYQQLTDFHLLEPR